MAGDIKTIFARLPADKRLNQATCEFLDQEIRKGSEFNLLQRESILSAVQCCIDAGTAPPPQLESFFAYAYNFWTEEMKQSEEAKGRLAALVRVVKAEPAVANRVAEAAKHILQEREARHRRTEELAIIRSDEESPAARSRANEAQKEAPKVYVARMQAARHGKGDNTLANLDVACQHAEEAVDAYPNSPEVLFEAAGCHQLLAEKGTHHSSMNRYVHLRQAFALYEQCLLRLASPPYSRIKGTYDKWRKGLTELLTKLQQELAALQEQQR